MKEQLPATTPLRVLCFFLPRVLDITHHLVVGMKKELCTRSASAPPTNTITYYVTSANPRESRTDSLPAQFLPLK